MARPAYRGRFAPSPTGLLHAGSLLAALASWLDARAHGGLWLVRIEDIDPFRDIPGAGEKILQTLARFSLASDEPVLWQHDRLGAYREALSRLLEKGMAYGCACSRHEILDWHHIYGGNPAVYPGLCRNGTGGRPVRSIRLRVDDEPVAFTDRRRGPFVQRLESELGDFIIRRADGLPAYQLAVVVDDGFQGVTDIVRGEDLLDNTPRQIALQRALGLPQPRYLHLPLVLNERGEKLSKQAGAAPLPEDDTMGCLERAWAGLGFPRIGAGSPQAFLRAAIPIWAGRWGG
ncbi:tRNA glutamyl-Q(34) synthetase GluQRS [Mesosutterella sp. OilRF-GAM-744-9]|uniref:Glutamyl-Q tRNA(Asp) synthetase n=1 Tax=Mesosutterella porci TaxID=2915351 RepID=A0ABS9MPF3_9BURK|nr:tRNA glutamyl-Q(34) synthetase GluQRS [Mesosutterella sp. oilRF-744-WT-GAM-9]MCG5030498.1 tRNA glutamyl-Q(34) synthetase GluQRS [Mesosutterella sp. oilRF-744-WT-GAM-9]